MANVLNRAASQYSRAAETALSVSHYSVMSSFVEKVKRSLPEHDERLALVDDVGGKLRGLAAAHVFR